MIEQLTAPPAAPLLEKHMRSTNIISSLLLSPHLLSDIHQRLLHSSLHTTRESRQHRRPVSRRWAHGNS